MVGLPRRVTINRCLDHCHDIVARDVRNGSLAPTWHEFASDVALDLYGASKTLPLDVAEVFLSDRGEGVLLSTRFRKLALLAFGARVDTLLQQLAPIANLLASFGETHVAVLPERATRRVLAARVSRDQDEALETSIIDADAETSRFIVHQHVARP